MMRTEFFLSLVPPQKTHQTKKARCVNGKPQFYESPELQTVRSKLNAHLAQHIPKEKYTGAVRLITKWCFPITGKHKDGEWKTTRPDCSNMIKLFEDVMTDLGFWTDDALIASSITEKFWAERPGIYVCIENV